MDKLKKFGSIKHSKTLLLLILLVVTIAIPLTIYLAGQQQDLRQRAFDGRTSPTVTSSVCSGTLGGFVYEDTNQNGARDTGEAGVPNIGVKLSGASQDSKSTDLTGYYEFRLLTQGDYAVTVDTTNVSATSQNPIQYKLDCVSNFGSRDQNFGVIVSQNTPSPTATPTSQQRVGGTTCPAKGSLITGCVSSYTGAMRMSPGGAITCSSGERELKWYQNTTGNPINACISRYTGGVRVDLRGSGCTSSEVAISWNSGSSSTTQITGCVSNFTGALRIGTCTSSDTQIQWSGDLTCPTPTPTASPTPTPTARPSLTPTLTPTASPTSPVSTNAPTATKTPSTPTPTQILSCGKQCENNASCGGGSDGCDFCVLDPLKGTNTCQRNGITPTTTPSQTSSYVFLQSDLPGIGQNLGDNDNPLNPNRTTDLQVFDTENNLVQTTTFTSTYKNTVQPQNTSAQPLYGGQVNIDVPPGFYYFKARFDNTLYTLVPGIYQIQKDTVNFLQTVNLIPGDLVQNNILDIEDYSLFVECFKGTDTCTQSSKADFNDDGKLDGTDYNILLRSFAIREGA